MTDRSKHKPKILIIDDVQQHRQMLASILSDDYEILETDDGSSGIAILQQQLADISLVLLDCATHSMDGFAVLKLMNENGWLTDTPVIMTASEAALTYARRAYELGVTDFIARPFDEVIVRNHVENTIKLYSKQRRLADLVAMQISERLRHNNMLITVLSHIVEFRNGESGMHVLHINTITGMLLDALMKRTDKYNLKPSDVALICTASSMHDIGKISIPNEILNKHGRLSSDEFDVIKQHSSIGAQMLENVPFSKEEPLMRYAYEICRWHHERWDGKGYPDGLQGEEIPIAAQIVSIADVYDALISERVYKAAYSHEQAIAMIRAGECGEFSPLLLECLGDISEELRTSLPASALGAQTARDFREVSAEMSYNDDLISSNRAYQKFEYEYQKFHFFLNVSASSIFEYTESPSVMHLSNAASEQLGLPKDIFEPLANQSIVGICIPEELAAFRTMVHAATPEKPSFTGEMTLPVYGDPKRCKLYCNTVWERGDAGLELAALYGKITLIE